MAFFNLRFSLDGFLLGDVVGWDVAFLLGGATPGEPPVALGVVENVEVFSLFKGQAFVCSRVVVVQCHESLAALADTASCPGCRFFLLGGARLCRPPLTALALT